MNYTKLYNDLEEMVGINEEGKEFTVIFIKKNGQKRTMKCRLTQAAENLVYGYLPVYEESPKNVNLNTLISLECEGVTYTINREKSEWTKCNG